MDLNLTLSTSWWQPGDRPAERGRERPPHEARGALPARGQRDRERPEARGEQTAGLQLLAHVLHPGTAWVGLRRRHLR